MPVCALAGLPQVELMQELAGGALLAQAAHPVLADEAVVSPRSVVLVGTGVSKRAVALFEGLAWRTIGVEAKAILALEEGVELEGEARRVVGRIKELVDDGRGGHGVIRDGGVSESGMEEDEMGLCMQLWKDKLAPRCATLHVIKRPMGILGIILPFHG